MTSIDVEIMWFLFREVDAENQKVLLNQKILLIVNAALMSFYLFLKYLVLKIGFLLIEIADFPLSPIMVFIVNYFSLLPSEFLTLISILIYFIIIYQVCPTLLKPIYGSFSEIWWLRIIFSGISIINFCLILFYPSQAAVYNALFILLCSLFLIIIIHDQSDLTNLNGPLQEFMKFLYFSKEYHELNELERSSKKEIKYLVDLISSSLFFNAICFIISWLLSIFYSSDVLFVFLVLAWMVKVLYDFIAKKKLPVDKDGPMVRESPIEEKGLLLNLLGFDVLNFRDINLQNYNLEERNVFMKYLFLLLNVVAGIFTTSILIFLSGGLAEIFRYFIYFEGAYRDVVMIVILLIIIASFFQFYFWYAVIKRHTDFLRLWLCSKSFWKYSGDTLEVFKSPNLPRGGFKVFLLNIFIINMSILYLELLFVAFINSDAIIRIFGTQLWAFLTEKTIYLASTGLIILLLEASLIFFTIKNRKSQETVIENLYADNKRIPVASAVQLFFNVISVQIFYLGSLLLGDTQEIPGEEIFNLEYNIFLLLGVSLCLFLCFYMPDISYYFNQKKSIETMDYNVIFSLVIMFLVLIIGTVFWFFTGNCSLILLSAGGSFIILTAFFVQIKLSKE